MKKQINDLLIKMQNGENCIGETANQLLDLFAVSVSLPEYELEFCEKCYQMTNHLDGICQKCKGNDR